MYNYPVMDSAAVSFLLALNRQFYQTFGESFADTRRRIQPGVRRVLERLPFEGRFLDLGCGSGALALEWARQARRGEYLGLDYSPQLLEIARRECEDQSAAGLAINFRMADLSDPAWCAGLEATAFNGVLAFAVLHHLPGQELRQDVLRSVRELLAPGGWFIHSEWQFQHSVRLLSRRVPWEKVGLRAEELDEGDTLLDWRHALPGRDGQVGLRYVHLFNRSELASLAEDTGFEIFEEFESDGTGGRLGLYQFWRSV
jgi:tRNA (uracil-5-)-methyltransferase TRM9